MGRKGYSEMANMLAINNTITTLRQISVTFMV